MSKLPKFFLTVSVTAFAVGFATISSNNIAPGWAVAMPIGAIFLGWFLIAFMLQKEVAQFDEETRLRSELMKRHAPETSRLTKTRSEALPAGWRAVRSPLSMNRFPGRYDKSYGNSGTGRMG